MNNLDINLLHGILLREMETDLLQEIDLNLYQTISEFIGDLKKQEYDSVENEILKSIINTATEMTSLLISIRMDKISRLERSDLKNLLDEEKFILDALEERHERINIVLSATIRGKTKFLESITQKHKTKLMVVRFLQDVDALVGADLEKYGPFKAEDIATIPYENAQALIAQDAATKIRWND